MIDETYEVVSIGQEPVDGPYVLKGKDIFYKCTGCGAVISSLPKKTGGCECGNIFMDLDALRLSLRDCSKVVVLRRVPRRSSQGESRV